ncbi:MAG: hypothetical protein WCP06_11280 [Verrucomicrobiota bacterium]
MILGDAQERVALATLLDFVEGWFRHAQNAADAESTRAALIAAGQLEQGFADAGEAIAEPVTDAAAEALIACWRCRPVEEIRDALDRGLAALALIVPARFETGSLLIKAPEGFAFYALFPEQYAEAAFSWAASRSHSKSRVLVVGIRSIGTTLSAVVKAALTSIGWNARRCTVRPEGGIYDRKITFAAEIGNRADWALVADEGPGNTGVSMAAAVFALEKAGIPRSRIGLFPSHAGSPGRESPDSVKACWKSVPSVIGHPPDIVGKLTAATERITGGVVIETQDWSAGAWRGHVFERRQQWPAVCAMLERIKHRCLLNDKSALVWKFSGFSGVHSQNANAEAKRLKTTHPWTPEPVAICDGFIATPWIRGTRMVQATPAFASHMGRYLAAACSQELNYEEVVAAHERITPLIEANLSRWLGQQAARRATELWKRTRAVPSPLCVDPRQPLHDWIETGPDQWIKTDSTGHLCDHTLAGRQPIEWGLAAACNACGPRETPALLSAFHANIGWTISKGRLVAYQIAQAAFRLGELELALTTGWPDNLEEQQRIQREARMIIANIKRLL